MITTIRVTDFAGSHVRLSIWVNHALICKPGGICLQVEELQPFVKLLQPDTLEADDQWHMELERLNIEL